MTLLAALLTLQQGAFQFSETVLPDAAGKPSNLFINQMNGKRVGGPKFSPRSFGTPPRKLEFEWLTAGFVEGIEGPEQRDLRFRVYSQTRKETGDPSFNVMRMLLRLWSTTRYEYGLEHNPTYNGGLVDVYLCDEGKPGGEQRFDVDDQQRPPAKVNTIYIYDIPSFTDPIEMAREVAHEYGHAVLPPVGGFKQPEDWANGYLGEKIYLRRYSREIAAGRLWSPDVMGADPGKLAAWVAKNVDPVTDAVALRGPRMDLLKTSGKASMDAYLGVALWMEEAYGARLFARSAKLNGMADVTGYMESVQLAVSEPDRIEVTIPARYSGKAIYLPVGKAKVEGAEVLLRKDSWVKIQPKGGSVVIVNR
ncbi:hypothetical protein EON81_22410 [bacterium]|nr:MAG: hypothetical protein EON81_22410 [bacterium]